MELRYCEECGDIIGNSADGDRQVCQACLPGAKARPAEKKLEDFLDDGLSMDEGGAQPRAQSSEPPLTLKGDDDEGPLRLEGLDEDEEDQARDALESGGGVRGSPVADLFTLGCIHCGGKMSIRPVKIDSRLTCPYCARVMYVTRRGYILEQPPSIVRRKGEEILGDVRPGSIFLEKKSQRIAQARSDQEEARRGRQAGRGREAGGEEAGEEGFAGWLDSMDESEEGGTLSAIVDSLPQIEPDEDPGWAKGNGTVVVEKRGPDSQMPVIPLEPKPSRPKKPAPRPAKPAVRGEVRPPPPARASQRAPRSGPDAMSASRRAPRPPGETNPAPRSAGLVDLSPRTPPPPPPSEKARAGGRQRAPLNPTGSTGSTSRAALSPPSRRIVTIQAAGESPSVQIQRTPLQRELRLAGAVFLICALLTAPFLGVGFVESVTHTADSQSKGVFESLGDLVRKGLERSIGVRSE